jgi:hypothetical protein
VGCSESEHERQLVPHLGVLAWPPACVRLQRTLTYVLDPFRSPTRHKRLPINSWMPSMSTHRPMSEIIAARASATDAGAVTLH